jgi:hypothetical protein
MSSEKDALLPSNASGNGPSYYFVKSDSSHHEARDMDGGEVIEQLPAGATEDDFAARVVGTPRTVSPTQEQRLVSSPLYCCCIMLASETTNRALSAASSVGSKAVHVQLEDSLSVLNLIPNVCPNGI